MFNEMLAMSSGSGGGGGTANVTYNGAPSGQSFSQNIQKSDYVVAMMFLSGTDSSDPCVLKPGQSGTIQKGGTTTQITFSSDGQNISFSKNTNYYYVIIIAFSTT